MEICSMLQCTIKKIAVVTYLKTNDIYIYMCVFVCICIYIYTYRVVY